MHRSLGVCVESDVGSQQLLSPVVLLSGAFEAATEIPTLAVKKKTLSSEISKHCSRNCNSNTKACDKDIKVCGEHGWVRWR